MLVELSIKNFAIIDNLSVRFGPGLNIFTGETGAGKSIIIDAISLVLGDRASNEVIRSSEEEAQVEALFDVKGDRGLKEVVSEAGLEYSENLVIKRVVQRAGRNRIYINGGLATLVTLTEVGRRLIDICGQSEHQSLTRPEEHIEVLDSYGDYPDLRAAMAEAYRGYVTVKKEYDALVEGSRDVEKRRDILSYESKEIGDADLKPGEDDVLNASKEKMRNAERIKAALIGAEKALYSDSGSASERAGAALKALKDVQQYDGRVGKVAESVESSLYQLEDAARTLAGMGKSIEYDPSTLDEIAERLDLIGRLKKKYGKNIEEILRRKEEADSGIAGLTSSGERLKALTEELKRAKEKAEGAAMRLTEARLKASETLKGKLEDELKTLGMKGASFEALVKTDVAPEGGLRFGEKGSDRVSFLISTNPGEEMKPLSRIASGGELSRIMLAMKRVTAAGRVPTIVFDEIDAGVGGPMAEAVGRKLKGVVKTHQVICITHMPQIAAFSDKHFSVKKETAAGRTVTKVRELKGDEVLGEITWMLAGAKATEVTRKHARELMDTARGVRLESLSKGRKGEA